MTLLDTRPALRWIAPVAVAAAVVGGGAALRTLSASADPSLPPRSAAQLLVDLQTARVSGLSGTVVQRADLGLPALPGSTGSGSSDLSSLASGTRTMRVWYAGPDKARVALLGTLGESDVIRDGRDVWTWESRSNAATHRVLPDGGADRAPDADQLPKTPQEAAELALQAIEPSTEVTTAGTARVAGRAAYELVLTPRDTSSLVRQARFAVDADQHVPLRAQVYAKGSDEPAYEVAFSQVSFARPDDAQFRFTPPPGATVREETADRGQGTASGPEPVVVGSGWTSVLAARMPAQPDGERGAAAVLEQLPKVSGPWGQGRLLRGRLFSVLLTEDGRLLVGAVSPDRLYQVAADPATAGLK